MQEFLKSIDGMKTYIGAGCFAALGLYELWMGQTQLGLQSLMAAWTAFGLRSAVSKVQTTSGTVKPSPATPPAGHS